MVCEKCGAANSSGANLCLSCGVPLPRPAAPPLAPTAQPWPLRTARPGEPLPTAINDGAAKASLAFGIASWLLCGFLTGIPAIILGHRAFKNIRQSRGHLKGKELAIAGLVMGYVSSALMIAFVIGFIVFFKIARKDIPANEANAVKTIRQINDAETAYSQANKSPYVQHQFTIDLATLGAGPDGTCTGSGTAKYACLLDGPLAKPECRAGQWCTLNGYKFQIFQQYSSAARDDDYAITATPVDNSISGDKTFCSTSDGVVRSESAREMGKWGHNVEGCLRSEPLAESK